MSRHSNRHSFDWRSRESLDPMFVGIMHKKVQTRKEGLNADRVKRLHSPISWKTTQNSFRVLCAAKDTNLYRHASAVGLT